MRKLFWLLLFLLIPAVSFAAIAANYVPKSSGGTKLSQSPIYATTTNVGIGTTTPSTALEVVGTIKATTFVGNISGVSNGWTTDGSTKSYTSYNVGIGNTSPTQKLDVTGTVKATAFSGPLTGNVTGNASGTCATVTGAAQTAITSVGTLTGLTVDGDIYADSLIVGGTMTLADGGSYVCFNRSTHTFYVQSVCP
jgi:hypothetical protein